MLFFFDDPLNQSISNFWGGLLLWAACATHLGCLILPRLWND